MKKHYRVVSIPRFVTFIVLCTILLLTSIYHLGGVYKASAGTAYASGSAAVTDATKIPNDAELYAEVIVSSGDTLWSIASSYYGSQVDKRQAVYEIQSMNHMTDTSLRTGQILKLPKEL